MYIAYYRVSTDEQGRPGLGLEAQRDAVRRCCADADAVYADDWRILPDGSAVATVTGGGPRNDWRRSRSMKLDKLIRSAFVVGRRDCSFSR